ncbi:MAG: hypothetical protein KBG40_07115 [Bacteroidales bacterium]|nr:hypothetical protein [Bacteroidales bacterium]
MNEIARNYLSLILILVYISTLNLFSQENSLDEIIFSITEEIASLDENSPDIELLSDRLYELADDRVKINTANEKEIGRLFFLSSFQINAIISYIRKKGRLISPYEIAFIDGFEKESVNMLLPFITLEESSIKPVKRNMRQSFLNNFIIKPGRADTSAPGSQWKILSKYRITSGKFSAGFTAEKDAGEKYFSGKLPLPDFLSAHIAYSGTGFINKIIVGDYSLRFGSGIIMNTGFRTGLSLSDPGFISAAGDIRPYTSTDENNFFRGVAVTAGSGLTEVAVFASMNEVDATVYSNEDSTEYFVRSFYTGGLHNSASSILKKDALKEFVYGISLMSGFKNFRAGILYTDNQFSLPFLPDTSRPENIFDFTGKEYRTFSFCYSAALSNTILTGEISFGADLKPAITQSLYLIPDDRLSLSLVYRHHPPSFTSFHGKAVFSGSMPVNENSVYGGFKFEAAKYLFINAGTDFIKYPWARYNAIFPSSAIRSEVRLKYLPPRKTNLELLYSFRYMQSDLNDALEMPYIKEERINSISLRFRHSLWSSLSLLTRFDYKKSSFTGSDGILLSQDVVWQPAPIPFRIWFRHCIFDTGDWSTRIYTYENDLLNSFSVPALYGEGSRSYLMVEWKVAGKVEIRMKYGITSEALYSESRKDAEEVKIQIRIKL